MNIQPQEEELELELIQDAISHHTERVRLDYDETVRQNAPDLGMAEGLSTPLPPSNLREVRLAISHHTERVRLNYDETVRQNAPDLGMAEGLSTPLPAVVHDPVIPKIEPKIEPADEQAAGDVLEMQDQNAPDQ